MVLWGLAGLTLTSGVSKQHLEVTKIPETSLLDSWYLQGCARRFQLGRSKD